MNRADRRVLAGLLLLAAALGCLYVRDVVLIVDHRLAADVAAAQGVVAGLPHWRVQQSRLLGPLAVEGLHRLGLSPRGAFLTFVGLATTATQAVIAIGLRRPLGTTATIVAMLATHVVATLLTYRGWFYAWDPGALLVLTTFAVLVARGASTGAFAALTVVGVLNRESALAIPLFLVLDPLVRARIADVDGRRDPLDRARIATGVALGIAGVVVLELVRSALLVREVGPELLGRDPGAGGGYHPTLLQNVMMTVQAFAGDLEHPIFAWCYPLVVVALIAALVQVAATDPRRWLAASIAFGALLVGVLTVGILFETRTLLELTPALTVLPLCAGSFATLAGGDDRWS